MFGHNFIQIITTWWLIPVQVLLAAEFPNPLHNSVFSPHVFSAVIIHPYTSDMRYIWCWYKASSILLMCFLVCVCGPSSSFLLHCTVSLLFNPHTDMALVHSLSLYLSLISSHICRPNIVLKFSRYSGVHHVIWFAKNAHPLKRNKRKKTYQMLILKMSFYDVHFVSMLWQSRQCVNINFDGSLGCLLAVRHSTVSVRYSVNITNWIAS